MVNRDTIENAKDATNSENCQNLMITVEYHSVAARWQEYADIT